MGTARAPIILVPACNRMLGQHPYHVAGKKYVDGARLAGGLPLVVPSASAEEIDALLDLAHGVLLTGSPSNVHPRHFDEPLRDPASMLDEMRDAWTLALIPKAIERGMPLLAICRGFQETNVALGGTLHQAVQEVPGHRDHRALPDASAELQYRSSHPVSVVAGGMLEAIVGESTFDVNSIHAQGVNRLAPGLRVEARAPDGLVEAFSIPQAPGFALCVQWHPEWQAADNPISLRLFKAFGDACKAYRDDRRRSVARAAS